MMKKVCVLVVVVLIMNSLLCYASDVSAERSEIQSGKTNEMYTDYLKYLIESQNPSSTSFDLTNTNIDISSAGNESIEFHWAKDAIMTAYLGGMINISSDARIRPDEPILRGEFAYAFSKWIKKNHAYLDAMGFDVSIQPVSFDDVRQGDEPFYQEIIEMAGRGVINGYSNKFGSSDSLTREQMCLIWANFLQKLKKGTVTADYISGLNVSSFLHGYTDYFTVSSWARNAVAVMTEQNYISGYTDGTFRPQGLVTRAEAYTVFSSLEKMVSSYYFYNTSFNYSPDSFYYDKETNVYVDLPRQTEEPENENIELLSFRAKKIRPTGFQLQFSVNEAAYDEDTFLVYGYSAERLSVKPHNIDEPTDHFYDMGYKHRKIRLGKLDRLYDTGDISYYVNISLEPGEYYFYVALKTHNQHTEVQSRRVSIPETES